MRFRWIALEAGMSWGYIGGVSIFLSVRYPQMPLTDVEIRKAKPAAKAFKLSDEKGLSCSSQPPRNFGD